MKKILLILLLLVSVLSYGQDRRSITWLRAQDITNTRNFIWQGDTINFTLLGQTLDQVTLEGGYLKFYNGGVIIDSVYWSYSQDIDALMISGDSILVSLSDKGLHYLNISTLTSKLDTVASDSTMSGQGTVSSPLTISQDIISAAIKTTYPIILPSASTIAGRIASPISIPDGWTLSVGSNAANLKITHNLGRDVSGVNVWYNISGTKYRQMANFDNAYGGIVSDDNNSVEIEGLTKEEKTIRIYVKFSQ